MPDITGRSQKRGAQPVNYAAYRQLRDELLTDRDFLRLDCMNPTKALTASSLSPCLPSPIPTDHGLQADIAEAISAWSSATGIVLDAERTLVGTGVRELLTAIFLHLQPAIEELWLPLDVYPVYWDLARRANLQCEALTTLPQPDWEFLKKSGEKAALLLPVPLSPLGRQLMDGEAETILRWLRQSPDRILIVDAVYTFDFDSGRSLLDLLLQNEKQCIVLWSCAKSWLAPGCLGLGAVPRRLSQTLQGHVATPTPTNLSKIHAVLRERPQLCRLQQEAFRREWRRLAPAIRKAAPGWQPPANGYFSVVSVPFATLLNDHGILSIPASVFGSRRNDLSILTCLYDLAAHEGGVQAS
ncbi:MAG TPA: aminotransferase class I/II-fold pyridoxal phosphate-dependent enzyme [Candidatus Angelobacter sp.]|nr:aminotransferase class I/II-fold pyridoxal phosphate-dependent enzyme [Candidatus Angelobacter sp.]